MEYKWIKNVAEISDDHTFIIFDDEFNEIIKPNILPEILTTLTFGEDFNQKIELNSLSDSLTTLNFGYCFNQKIEPNILPESLTTIIFSYCFNQKIKPNSLPESLTNLTIGCHFNQKIDLKILPSNLKYIEFNWMRKNKINISSYIEMVNNIPGYYDVKIFLSENIFGDNCLKWPIHVHKYEKNQWSLKIYVVIDNYTHPFRGDIIVLINKKSYQPYSSAKSALK